MSDEKQIESNPRKCKCEPNYICKECLFVVRQIIHRQDDERKKAVDNAQQKIDLQITAPSSTDWARDAAKALAEAWDTVNNVRMGALDQISLEQSIEKALMSVAKKAREEAVGESAKIADELALGFHSPHEYSDNVAERIRALLADKGTK